MKKRNRKARLAELSEVDSSAFDCDNDKRISALTFRKCAAEDLHYRAGGVILIQEQMFEQ